MSLVLSLLAGGTLVWVRSDPREIRVGLEWEASGEARLSLDSPRWGPAVTLEVEVRDVLAAEPPQPSKGTSLRLVSRSSLRLERELPIVRGWLRERRAWGYSFARPAAEEISLRGVVRLRDGSEKRFQIGVERGGGYWFTPLFAD